jgi:hypothetical protein
VGSSSTGAGGGRPASSGRPRLRIWHRERSTLRRVGTSACREGSWSTSACHASVPYALAPFYPHSAGYRPRADQDCGRGQHGRGGAGVVRRVPAASLYGSRCVARHRWRRRGVSPHRGKAYRLRRCTLLRGLLLSMGTPGDTWRAMACGVVQHDDAPPRADQVVLTQQCVRPAPGRQPGSAIPTASRSPEEVTSSERPPASPTRARVGDTRPAPLSPLP